MRGQDIIPTGTIQIAKDSGINTLPGDQLKGSHYVKSILFSFWGFCRDYVEVKSGENVFLVNCSIVDGTGKSPTHINGERASLFFCLLSFLVQRRNVKGLLLSSLTRGKGCSEGYLLLVLSLKSSLGNREAKIRKYFAMSAPGCLTRL